MRAVAGEVAQVLLLEEDGDWALFTVGRTNDGDIAIGRDAGGTFDEVFESVLDDVPVVIGRGTA